MFSPPNKKNNFKNNISQINLMDQIEILSKKFSQLEESYNNLNQILKDEISQRKNLEKKSITSLDTLSGSLNILKNNYEKIEEVLIENLSKIKEDIKLINPSKNINQNINENNNSNSNEEFFKKEFIQYRTEINKNLARIELLENQLNISNKEYQQNLNDINRKMDNSYNDLRTFKDFQEQYKIDYQKIREEFNKTLNNNKNYLNKINNVIIDFQKNMDLYNSSYNQYFNELKNLKENIIIDKDNNNKKIETVESGINEYINDRNKELENFENHLLNEYDKFVNFIQLKFEEFNEGIKKMVDYNIEDIKVMKEKMELFQEAYKKLRIDLFKGLNETEDFFEKKYNSILKIINK